MRIMDLLLTLLPPQASTFSGEMDHVFWVITWITGISFILVEGLLIFFTLKYRRKKNEPDKKTPFMVHSAKMEFFWTLIPTILLFFIFYIGAKVYVEMRIMPKAANTVELKIKGNQWYWTFTYDNGVKGTTKENCEDPQFKTPTDCLKQGKIWKYGDPIRVPQGRPVHLAISSGDVVHSFYVPAFRIKQDAVPGYQTQLWFNAITKGKFQLFCAEYCRKAIRDRLFQS